ncbi:MAG TPA: hypothetical protein VHE59_07785 [Mucilaginibacter sp.]|nr:hypothetical protein [Mucilaginibacter sp.]
MNRTYTTTKGWKIFMYVICGASIAIVFGMFINAIVTKDSIAVFTTVFLVVSGLVILWIMAVKRSKPVVTDDSFTEFGVFRFRQLLFSQIKGFRVIYNSQNNNKRLVLIPAVTSLRKITIGDPSYFNDGNELYEFIQHKFTDLDQVEFNAEVTEIVDDPAIGATEAERQENFAKIKKAASVLNTIGLAITFWLFIYPYPYPLPIYVGLIYPFIVFIFFVRNQHVVTLTESKQRSAYPGLTLAFIMPPLGLMIRALVDYDLIEFSKCLIPVAVLLVVLTIMFFILIDPAKNRAYNLLAAVVFTLVYSYSAIISINCVHDRSNPSEIKARVLDHRISSGKSTSYYLSLSAWGTKQPGEEVTVSKGLYRRVNLGDTVTVFIKKGMLNIPWYFIDK